MPLHFTPAAPFIGEKNMNINITEKNTDLPSYINENVSSLMGLTGGRTYGIIVCDEMVTVADWEGQTGLPCFSFSYDITFIEPEHVTLTGCWRSDDVRSFLPGRMEKLPDGGLKAVDMDIRHDNCGDIAALFENERPQGGICFRLYARGEFLRIIVPDGWV